MPNLSIVMPVYNGSQYLCEAMESIRNQTILDWELICIDDGSSDGSANLIAQAAAQDNRIRLITCQHQGIVSALNIGVAQSNSPFIARMDADDVALPMRFELQLDHFHRHPEVSFLGTAYEVIDADGTACKSVQLPLSHDAITTRLQRSNCLAHPTMMMRAQALAQISGPYRNSFPFGEDYDLWLRASERFQFANLPDVLLQYRRDLSTGKAERIIVQCLSTVAAQISREQREAGMPDPALTWQADQSFSGRDSQRTLAAYQRHFGIPHEQFSQSARRMLLSDAREAKKQGHLGVVQRLKDASLDFAPNSTDIQSRVDFYWRLLKLFWTRSRVQTAGSGASQTMVKTI